VVAALFQLSKEELIEPAVVKKAIKKYGIDPESPNPVTR
jgi:pyruvate dehydrogenase complex dehydrogenase (E1) component